MSVSHCAARGGARVRARLARVGAWGLVIAGASGMLPADANAASVVSISGAPVTSLPAAKYYNFQPSATDSLHKTLTFSIANKPAWAGFDSKYGRLYGSPVPANVGTYGNIVISATDGTYKASLPAFSITVTPLADPGPVIGGTPPTSAVVGKLYTFQPTGDKGHDSYGLSITFGIYNKPAWLTLNRATGQLSGTPTAANIGKYTQIIESVSDGYKNAALPAFNLTVVAAAAPPPPAPTYSSVNLQWLPPTENTDASPLTNLAGYHVYYGTAPQSLTSTITVANPGIAGYVVENLTPGTWYFAVAAYNSFGVEGELSDLTSMLVQ